MDGDFLEGEADPIEEVEEELPHKKTKNLDLGMNESWYGRPLEEVDPLIFEDTFCVISKKFDRHYIFRYSATKSLFLLGPMSSIRQLAILITTHSLFDIILVLTILANCVTLAMTTNIYDQKTGKKIVPSYEEYTEYIEYGFLVIYTLEMILKIVAKGLVLNRFSYLRNRWNLLDLIVVGSGWSTVIQDLLYGIDANRDSDLNFLRTLRVLRAIKTMVILPGLKMMINALLTCIVELLEVMGMTFVFLMICTLFSQELFIGKLSQKCVIDKGGRHDPDRSVSAPIKYTDPDKDEKWTMWVSNWKNWKRRDFPKNEPTQCGNASSSRQCGDGYTCISQLGLSPDSGWTSFDNFFRAMLSTLQLLTLDFWERVYDVVVSTTGIQSLVFFIPLIFVGAYYLLNLMLAVVAMSYERTTQQQGDSQDLSSLQKLGAHRKHSAFSFDDLSKLNLFRMTTFRKRSKSEKQRLEQRLKMAGIEEEMESENERKENMHLDDTIFNLLGLRTPISDAEEPRQTFGPGVMEEQDALLLFKVGMDAKLPTSEDAELKNNDRPRISTTTEAQNYVETLSDLDVDEDENVNPRPTFVARWKAHVASGMRRVLTPVVNHRFFDWTIMSCIVLNTVCLAMEHHGASAELIEFLRIGNRIFMAVFTTECILKLMALQGDYFTSGWNIFDMIIVLISYIDLAVADEGGSRGFSVMRSVRLLRVFKLAQSWVTMKVLLNIIYGSFDALGNLTLVLLIVLYIFAVMGMQMVGDIFTYKAFDAEEVLDRFPRWHWRHFWYAFMMVFRILCGEWIEPLVECLEAQEYNIGHRKMEYRRWEYFKCFIIYIPILIIGNFIVLNLFLALLLNSFDSEELSAQREKELEATGRTENLKNIVGLLMLKKDATESEYLDDDDDDAHEKPSFERKKSIRKSTAVRKSMAKGGMGSDNKIFLANQASAASNYTDSGEPYKSKSTKTVMLDEPTQPAALNRSRHRAIRKRFVMAVRKVIMKIRIQNAERAIARMERHLAINEKKRDQFLFLSNPVGQVNSFAYDETPESSEASGNLLVPGDCCPPSANGCLHRLKLRRETPRRQTFMTSPWERLRIYCVAIVNHPIFEYLILILIFGSSITLAFEDVYLDQKPKMKEVLCYLNFSFTGFFVLEMFIKIIAIGAWGYFTSFWTILDVFIVIVSVITFYFDIHLGTCTGARSGTASNWASLKALRTLRALRPLRAISRWEGMKIIVNALIYAIPSIANVLLVCLLFWLIFSIMGVQFFKGQFYRCVNEEGERVSALGVPNREVCCAKAETHGYSWINTISNYDNVFEGYLSLFQVATFEGWMELMEYSVDAVGVDKQPIYDYQISYYVFYVIFIIFGSFFVLQLFIGVIIDNFNMLKKKYEGGMLEILLTPTQRHYYTAMKNLNKRKPKPVLQRPKSPFFGFFYDVAMSRRLEIIILIVICLNMVLEAVEMVNTHQHTRHMIAGFSAFFATIYFLEALIKIIGLGGFYFTITWNVYDFVLVVASICVTFLEDLSLSLPLPPTMLRIVRIIRIGKMLRLVKFAQGIRKLLSALVVSIPALFNICALLSLITFIYAILGMSLIGKAPRKWAIDDVFNFETFISSCLILIRLMTAAGWNEVMDSLTVVYPLCGTYRTLECGMPGEPDCPNRAIVVFYIVSYLIITYLIVINLYIAVILENYVEACNGEEVGIVEDDLDMFYNNWAPYDPYATQFIDFYDLPEFLDRLDPPLQVPKPNIVAIVAFNIPIARGNKVHCLDILLALIHQVLGPPDDSKEFRKIKNQMERKFQKQFSTRNLLDIVSSSRQWKIEHNAALTIQRAWKAYRARKIDIPMVNESTQTRRSLLEGSKSHGGLGHMMNRLGNVKKDPSTATGLTRKSRTSQVPSHKGSVTISKAK